MDQSTADLSPEQELDESKVYLYDDYESYENRQGFLCEDVEDLANYLIRFVTKEYASTYNPRTYHSWDAMWQRFSSDLSVELHNILAEEFGFNTDERRNWKPRSVVQTLADRDGWCCKYCEQPLLGTPLPEPQVDHVIPSSRGGDNTIDNKVLSCRSCNSSKNARTPEEWLVSIRKKAVRGEQ